METTGRAVNRRIIEAGIVALVDLRGDRVWFYPAGKLPPYLHAYLNINGGRPLRQLRDYLVNLGRGIVTD